MQQNNPLFTCPDGLILRHISPPLYLKDFCIIAFDMDSTLIDMETIDEIAAVAGKKQEVAAITEAAMRGEIKDYKESLRQRVAMLKGVCVSSLEKIRDQRMRLNPGAETLVHAAQKNGLLSMVVSGGFTLYTDRLKETLKLDYTRSNLLDTYEGRLTGKIAEQAWGDICDGEEKKRFLLSICKKHAINPQQAIAMGDGANDIPMLQAVGLAVAYHAKPIVQEKAHIAINQGGLDRLLEVVLPVKN